MYIDHQHTPSG